MLVIGSADRLTPLEGDVKADDSRGKVFAFSVEGFSMLVNETDAQRMALQGLIGKVVRCTVKVLWRGGGKRPLHWLTDVREASVG